MKFLLFHCLISFQWAGLRKALTVVFIPLHQAFTYIDKMPLELSLHQAKQSQCSQPCFLSLHLRGPLVDPLQYVHAWLSPGEPSTGPEQRAGGGRLTSLDLLAVLFLRQPMIPLAFWINRAQEGVRS